MGQELRTYTLVNVRIISITDEIKDEMYPFSYSASEAIAVLGLHVKDLAEFLRYVAGKETGNSLGFQQKASLC